MQKIYKNEKQLSFIKIIMLTYSISFQATTPHLIDFIFHIDNIKTDFIEIQLPAWRPGRYELQNFAKNIQKFNVKSKNNKNLIFKKITKDRWKIDTKGLTEIKVEYNYYAVQMDAGGTYLDDNQLYINFCTCLPYVEGRINEPCKVQLLDLPKDYKIACGLKNTKNTLQATDYHELVDSPMIASKTLQHYQYEVAKTTFNIWIQGDWKISDLPTLLSDFQSFTKKQLDMMKEFPFEEYHFLVQALPQKHYHGVEHRNSTVIVLGASELMNSEESYKNFLGVCSHELFHAWNICKIRPAQMLPYDYTKENYFDTGFVAEGITTYYGDLFLMRSGVWKYQQYLKELNDSFKKHFNNFGCNNHSLVDSSLDLWLDGYSAGIPDRKVSIYAKGSIVALILDLEIRKSTKNKKSLDDVMRVLWADFGRKGIGYTMESFKEVAEKVAGKSLQKYFDECIFGKYPLEKVLDDLLEHFGFVLITNHHNKGTEMFDFECVYEAGKLLVSMIVPNTKTARFLSLKDEIIALDGRRVENNINELLHGKLNCELTIFRNKQLKNISLNAEDAHFHREYYVQLKNGATKIQQEYLEKWLNH